MYEVLYRDQNDFRSKYRAVIDYWQKRDRFKFCVNSKNWHKILLIVILRAETRFWFSALSALYRYKCTCQIESLEFCFFQPFFKIDLQLGSYLGPVPAASGPFFSDVLHSQIQHFEKAVIGWKYRLCLSHFLQRCVDFSLWRQVLIVMAFDQLCG